MTAAPPELSPVSAPRGRLISTLRSLWGRLSLSNLQIILVILVVIGGRLIIDFSQRIVEGQRKVAQQTSLEAQIADLQRDQQRLEADKVYYSSPAYVEVWAHSEGKMVQEGEKLIVPLYKGEPRPKRPALAASPSRSVPNWYVWWVLFFDAPPPFSWADGSPQP